MIGILSAAGAFPQMLEELILWHIISLLSQFRSLYRIQQTIQKSNCKYKKYKL